MSKQKEKKLNPNRLAKKWGWHLCGQSRLQAVGAHTQPGCALCSCPGVFPCWQGFGGCPGFFSAVPAGALCGIAPTIMMSSSGLPLELKIASNWSAWAMMGQLVGKEKPLFSTHWVFWRPCAGKQPGCVSEDLYFGSTWVKPAGKNNYFFIKLSSIPVPTCFSTLWGTHCNE